MNNNVKNYVSNMFSTNSQVIFKMFQQTILDKLQLGSVT